MAAFVVLLGYGLGMDALVRLAAHFPAIMPSTVVSFMFLAACIGSVCSDFTASRALATAGALAVIAIAGANLLLNAFGQPGGLDALIGVAARPGDMMAPGTAYGLILAAVCVCGLAGRGLVEDLALYGAMTGLTTTLGVLFLHSFDPNSPMSVPFFRSTSVLTAVLFLLTFAAVLLELGLFGGHDAHGAGDLLEADLDNGPGGPGGPGDDGGRGAVV